MPRPTPARVECLEPRRLLATYSITDLGSEPAAINSAGQVAGTSHDDVGGAFLYTDGSGMQALGGAHSFANDVNDAGQVVGSYFAEAGRHAFLHAGGRLIDLGTLPGGATSEAFAINTSGVAVGRSDSAAGSKAVLFAGGTVTSLTAGPLGDPSTSSSAQDINDDGAVVDWFRAGLGAERGFVVAAGGAFTDLSGRVGDGSSATAINSRGDIVGTRTGGGFMYRDGAVSTWNGFAPAEVNDSGWVVGNVSNHAAVAIGEAVIDLNDLIGPASGWTLFHATGINARGQIAGWGSVGGRTRAFRLTPADDPPLALPFPAPVVRPPAGVVQFRLRYFAPDGVDASTVGPGDVVVTGPDGTPLTIAAAAPDSGGSVDLPLLSVAYTLAGPGGAWDPADSGRYTVAVRAGSVLDARGRAVAAATGSVDVTIDATPPAATLLRPDPPATEGVTFRVRFEDDTALDASTLGADDLQVTAPDGTAARLSFVRVMLDSGQEVFPPDREPTPIAGVAPQNSPGDSKALTAEYRVHARTASWGAGDAGNYTVSINPDNVGDTAGNAVAAGGLGTLELTEEFAGSSAFIQSIGSPCYIFCVQPDPGHWKDFRGTDPDGTRFTFRVRGGGGSMYATPGGYNVYI